MIRLLRPLRGGLRRSARRCRFLSDQPHLAWDFDGAVNWFPGHMAKGMREMEERIRDVDAIVEVLDARIPLSSRSHQLDHLLSRKNRLIVFNKADLADKALEDATAQHSLAAHFGGGDVSVLHTVCKGRQRRNVKKIIPTLAKGINLKFSSLGGMILILGVPNVGKSTLINAIRHAGRHDIRKSKSRSRSKKTKTMIVGAEPGVTKNVSKVQVWSDPTMFMIDSPGILVPRIEDPETALKLALTGGIRDKIIGEDIICEYLLYRLNLQHDRTGLPYPEVLGLDGPTKSLSDVLQVLGSDSVGQMNACRKLLGLYRDGSLGRFCLDDLEF